MMRTCVPPRSEGEIYAMKVSVMLLETITHSVFLALSTHTAEYRRHLVIGFIDHGAVRMEGTEHIMQRDPSLRAGLNYTSGEVQFLLNLTMVPQPLALINAACNECLA